VAKKRIAAIWSRTVQEGEFYNIERAPDLPSGGGGGARYIEIPETLVDGTLRFLSASRLSDGSLPERTIVARVIGDPAVSSPLEFKPKAKAGGRLRIANQNRQAPESQRHPAWQSDNGFPKTPDSVADRNAAAAHMAGGIHVYLVRTTDGDIYAGFTTGSVFPSGWPDEPALRALFDVDITGKADFFATSGMSAGSRAVVARVFDAWRRGKGALLYGPPGTGKTFILSELRARLESGAGEGVLWLETDDKDDPFSVEPLDLPIPTPVVTDWITFHQNYSYEDFVLGLRPQPSEGGLGLKARMGRLLDRALEVSSEEEEAESAVFFVDEINRGNTSRIFGEFITFMDFDYRDPRADGGANPLRLPIPLPSLNASAPDRTEPVMRPSGDEIELPIPWYFPRHVYMVATMNSVDRAAVPLDSALARRFDRIELRPDMNLLARHLDLSIADVEAKALEVRSGTDADAWTTLSAGETAILLLDRLNVILANDLGEDFELGHGLLWDVAGPDANRWEQLAIAWDEIVYPQLLDRYGARPTDLRRVLKVEEPPPDAAEYAFRPRTPMGSAAAESASAIAPVRLSDVDSEVLMTTMRWLTV
jgi:hypothetical protein